MKNLSLLFIAIIVVFGSCSSDDDNVNNQIDLSVDITGIWNLTAFEIDGGNEITFNGQTFSVSYNALGTDFDAQLVFATNPNTYEGFGTYTLIATFDFMGMTETEEYLVSFEEEVGSGQWSIQGNHIILENDNGEDRNAQIIHLTQNKMVLIEEVEMDTDGLAFSLIAETVFER